MSPTTQMVADVSSVGVNAFQAGVVIAVLVLGGVLAWRMLRRTAR